MLSEVLVFSCFALALAAALYRTWERRRQAEEEASLNARLALLGQSVDAIAHDLNHLMTIVLSNLQGAQRLPPEELAEAASDVEQAAQAAAQLIRAMRGQEDAGQGGAAGNALRLFKSMMHRRHVDVRLEITGELAVHGSQADLLRVIENLLANAEREAQAQPDGWVSIELRPGELRIGNPVRDPSTLDDTIWKRGVSRAGSSGLGLANVREAAQRLGWSVRHEVDGRVVTFVVRDAGPA